MKHFIPGLLAAILYGVVSGSMSFMNKLLLTTYKYHYPDVIMLIQVIATSIIVEICRLMTVCDIPCWTLKRCKEFFLPSVCFALHTTLALAALDDLSIPIYNVLRRMLPLASLFMTVFILKQTQSINIVLSVALMAAGTLFAGAGDLRFSYIGYGEAIASVIAQSIYLVYVQKSGIEKGASALSVLHLNSINCIPVMMIYTLMNGHLLKSFHFSGFTDSTFVVTFVCNIFLGCLLNYTLFLCATMNSALTTSIVGVIKGVLTTTIGFFTFGGLALNVLTVGGVVLNALGGALYVMMKYREKIKYSSVATSFLNSTDNANSTSDSNSHNNATPRRRTSSRSDGDTEIVVHGVV